MFRHPERDRFLAALEIGACGRGNDAEDIFRRRTNAQEAFAREHEGAQIEAAFAAGYPRGVDLHQCLDSLHENVFGQHGHRHAFGRLGEAAGIFLRPEHGDAAILKPVSLHAFEDFLRIMQHGAGRIELKRLTRADRMAVPPMPFGVADCHHMIGEQAAETRILQQYRALVSRHSLAAGVDGKARLLLDVHDQCSSSRTGRLCHKRLAETMGHDY